MSILACFAIAVALIAIPWGIIGIVLLVGMEDTEANNL